MGKLGAWAGLVPLAVSLMIVQVPTLTLTPVEGAAGQVLTVSGSGFDRCVPEPPATPQTPPPTDDATDSPNPGVVIESVPMTTLRWDDGPRLESARIDSGHFTTTIIVPDDVEPGTHLVIAYCWVGDVPDEQRVAQREFTVRSSGPPTSITPAPATRTTAPTRTPVPSRTITQAPSTVPSGTTTPAPSAVPVRNSEPSRPTDRGSVGARPAVYSVSEGWLLAIVLLVAAGVVVARVLRARRPASPARAEPPAVTAVVVAGHPASLEVRPLPHQRTVALSVVVRAHPEELTVSGGQR